MSQYDKISLDRIETAHPVIRERLREAFKVASDRLTGKVFLRLAYVNRSFAEQTALYALGRSVLFLNGIRQGIVTWAKAGQSFHNYGLAFDIVLIYRNAPKASFDIEADYDNDTQADWMEAVNVFKNYGFEWGGDWKAKKDLPHFQATNGKTWQQLFALYNSKSFITNTNFVKLT
jgi:peptidoglycan LD-endopeptidase CwlK